LLPLTFYCNAALQFLYVVQIGWLFTILAAAFFISLNVKVANALGLLSIMRLDQIKLLKQTHILEEEALLQREMVDLGYLTASITHEVRSPLGIINLQLRTLTQDLQANPKLLTTLDRIREQLDRINAATGVIPLLQGANEDFRRLMERIELRELLLRSVNTVRKEGGSSNIYFRGEGGEGLYINAYGPILEQAIVNILKNAVDAVRELGSKSGVIEIRGGREPDSSEKVRVVIADNGCGIPADIIPNILAPLFTTKRKEDSHSGIGLFIANRIILLHGGELHIESTVGEGTKVSLVLPRWAGRERNLRGN
jgi:signal transduction histidine kinase